MVLYSYVKTAFVCTPEKMIRRLSLLISPVLLVIAVKYNVVGMICTETTKKLFGFRGLHSQPHSFPIVGSSESN